MNTKRVRFSILGKLVTFLFWLSLTAFVGVVCLKPVSSSVIKDTFLNTKLEDKVTDVIYEVYPEITTEQMAGIEQIVEENQAVDDLVDIYLEAAANGGKNVQIPSTEKLFAGLNDEVLNKAAEKFGISITEEQKQQVTEILENQEEQINSTVKNVVEKMSASNSKVTLALKYYDMLTSTAMMSGLAAVTVLLGLFVIVLRKDRIRFMKNLGLSGILSGIILGGAIPAGVWAFGADITNRFLGQTVDIDVKICMEMGALLAVTGLVLVILRTITCAVGRKALA